MKRLGTQSKMLEARQVATLAGTAQFTESIGSEHNIDGPVHLASGLTAGHVLRATAATTFAFQAIQDADLPATIARDSEVSAAVSAHEGAADPHAVYLLASNADGAGLVEAARVLSVGAGIGIQVNADDVQIKLKATSGLEVDANGLALADSVAGAGLVAASKVLAVGAGTGITVNADDVAVNTGYAFVWGAAHTFNAGLTVAAGQNLNFGADVSLTRLAANVLGLAAGDSYRSTTFVSGISGWNITAAGDAEFNSLLVRGAIHASVFEKATVSAFAGSWIVTKSAGKLSVDYTVGGTMTIESPPGGGWTFETGDIVRIKAEYAAGVGDTWVTVTRTGTENEYTTTYQSGTNSIVWPKGTAAVDYGVSGDGGLFATADESNSPRLDVFTHAGAPWTTLTSRVRMGNLNGWGPFDSERYGWAAGDYSGGKYAYYDPTNGMVISGNLVLGPGVGYTLTDVMLHCKFDGPLPYATDYQVDVSGHLGQKATASGGVIGRTGKFGKAVQAAEATTNKVLCASAEGGGAYSSLGDATVTQSSDYAVYGTKSYKIVTTAAVGDGILLEIDTLANAAHNVSFYCRSNLATLQASLDGGSNWNTITSIVAAPEPGWYIYSINIVAAQANGSVELRITQSDAAARTFYIDADQVEEKAYRTPYCDGSLGDGHLWSASAHASVSSRTAASLAYATSGNIVETAGTVAAWVYIGATVTVGAPQEIFRISGSSAGYIILRVLNGTSYAYWGTSAAFVTGGAFSTGSWHHVAMTYDGTTLTLYLDGSVSGTPTATSGFSGMPTYLYVGSNGGSNQFLNGLVDELTITSDVKTADEIKQIYQTGAPLTVAASPFQLMLTGAGLGKVIGHSGGLFGTTTAGKPSWTLLNEDTTVNGESLGAGDVLFGDNSASKANLLWDASAGKVQFRGGTTMQCEIGTDGSILAGGGGIALNSSGLIVQGFSQLIEWKNTFTGNSYGSLGLNADSYLVLRYNTSSSGLLISYNTAWVAEFTSAKDVYLTNDLRVNAGIYVGGVGVNPPTGVLEGTEISDPGVAPANGWRLYGRDNGSGKTQLCVVFSSGAVQVLATEP